MKQTLSLKLGQQLTMTPQLQQAIRLLQLSSLDLQQEVQQVLEANPMLELEEEAPEVEEEGNDEPEAEVTAAADDSDEDGLPAVDDEWDQPTPEDLPVDTSWDEVYPASSTPSAPAEGDDWDFDSRQSAGETLQDHLLWQLNLTPMSDVDRVIGSAIIDAIDDDGMLTSSVDDLTESLNTEQLRNRCQTRTRWKPTKLSPY